MCSVCAALCRMELNHDDALRIANETGRDTYHPIGRCDILDTKDVAYILGIKPSSLRAMRSDPDRHPGFAGFPAPFRRIGTKPIWRTYEIRAWMAMRDSD